MLILKEQSSRPGGGHTVYVEFEDDNLLKNIKEQTVLKNMYIELGVYPDKFTEEKDNIRFYKTKTDEVWLRSNQSKGVNDAEGVAIIKNISGDDEGTNKSRWSLNEFIKLTGPQMKDTLNRVAAITEGNSNMKKILKEEYQKRQNDKEIISKRFNILSESKSADLIISEVDYLQKQKFSSVLIKEALFDLINILYKDDPNAIPKLKDSYKNWLTKKLPNEGDLFTRNLEKSIDNIKNEDVPLLFSDCNKIVELIYSSMIENMVDDNFDVVGVPNDIESIIKKEIIDNLKKDEMKMKIKDQLTNKICPQYGELIRNTEKTFEDLKGKLLS